MRIKGSKSLIRSIRLVVQTDDVYIWTFETRVKRPDHSLGLHLDAQHLHFIDISPSPDQVNWRAGDYYNCSVYFEERFYHWQMLSSATGKTEVTVVAYRIRDDR